MSVGDRGWRDQAVCRDEDPELFFPVGTGSVALEQTARAKAVCVGCPVRAACLEFALSWLPEGVAGGLSPEERRELRARRGRAAARSSSATVTKVGLPSGVDGLVVDQLVAGRVVGASRLERAWAAVVLHRAGRGVGWIAARLGVHGRQVSRWVERARAGVPLDPGGSGTGAVA